MKTTYKKLIIPSSKTEDELNEIIENKLRLLYVNKCIIDDKLDENKLYSSVGTFPIYFIVKYNDEIRDITEKVYKENKPKYDYRFWYKVSELNPVEGMLWCIDDGGDGGEKWGSVSIEVDDWCSMNFEYDEFDAIEEMWNIIQTLPKLTIKRK